MKKTIRARLPLWLAFCLLPAALLVGCGDNGRENGPPQGPPPMPAVYLPVAPEEIVIHGEYAGRVHGSREVEVRARVAGILEKRLYTEGETVRQNQPLFRIDPEPFAIAEQRAKAEQAAAQAELEQAQRELQRNRLLYEQDAISQRERDLAQTQSQLAAARLALTDAALADARRNLRYSEVAAPIGGITGLESRSEGSLVEPGALLTTLTVLDPVQVHFALPEEDAMRLAKARGSGAAQVTLSPGGASDDKFIGKLDFIDRVIDPQTGTVRARAVFPNPDGLLRPGQLVRVRLVLQQLGEVFAVPAAAVGEGRQGPQVLVIDEADTVRVVPVSLGPTTSGRQVILSGLNAGDRLVINGQVALGDGMPVTPIPAP